MNKVLIVDDDDVIRQLFTDILNENGFSTMAASNGQDAIGLFREQRPVAVTLDLKMPAMDGIETMLELKKIDPDIPVIIVTAFGDIPTAVESIKLGAYDFIVKPAKIDRLLFTLQRAIKRLELERSVKRLNSAVDTSLEWSLGWSEGMKKIIGQVKQVAWSDFSIIIQGETGTGKTFIARTIHNLSKRADKPFITVDISVIPETLVESELFGYEKGAFTGADKKRTGFFEIANGGTILIDEMENMSPYVQSKLLSVAEEKRIYPLGSSRPVDVDVRIIAATNTDIRKNVIEKKFREDLFYRLGEFIITLPALRERVQDIPFLAQKFLSEAGEELNKNMREISEEAVNLLMKYQWRGNVRELKNVIRRAVLLSEDSAIRPEHLQFLLEERADYESASPMRPLKELSASASRDVEAKAIRQALTLTKGNKTKAALMLRVDYKTLLTKIKEYSIMETIP